MAYVAGRLINQTGLPPGRNVYRYDTDITVDTIGVIETAGFFNNLDDSLNLAKGDQINVFSWDAGPFLTASLVQNAMQLIVTNVIANDAATSAGAVNTAQVFLGTSLFSSLL